MIGYVTLGTNRMKDAAAFYDELLALVNAARIYETERFTAWGINSQMHSLAIAIPEDGKPATVGNGTMLAIPLPDPASVDAFHAKALALGGTDAGAPGPRGASFYAGYFRDLDGNKLNGFCFTGD